MMRGAGSVKPQTASPDRRRRQASVFFLGETPVSARFFVLSLALLAAAVGCEGKKKSLYDATHANPREPISSKPLTGQLFSKDDPFTVVSGYAYSEPIGGGSVKLFDTEVTPCQTTDDFDGRMVSITIPGDAVEFFFDTLEDSKAIQGAVVFVQGDTKVSSVSAEFKRTELTDDTLSAGLSATDVRGNAVNGKFSVKRCTGRPGGSTATATASSTATDASTDDTAGAVGFTIANLPADDGVPKFLRLTLTLAGADTAAAEVDEDPIPTHSVEGLEPGSYAWTVELIEDAGRLIGSASGEVDVTEGASADVEVQLQLQN
jgi:hypothetical protein